MVKVSSAKKLPGKDDNDTINDLSPLLTLLAEVKRFLPATLGLFASLV